VRDVHKNSQYLLLGCFWLLEGTDPGVPKEPPDLQTYEWKALKVSFKAANEPKWASHSRKHIWELGGTIRDGTGSCRKVSDKM
jgi:hypothetical protein